MTRKQTLPPVLRNFWIGILALTALSLLYTFARTHVAHTQRPWGLQFLYGVDVGWDFNIFRDRFLHFRQPGFWQMPSYPLTYPAAIGVAFGLFYKLAHPLRDYVLLCIAASCAWVAWLVRRLARQGISPTLTTAFALTVLATSWPLWFLFDTGNIEGLVVIVLAAGLIAFANQRWWIAAALIGLAGAFKIFPIIMLALLLSRRRYREFAAGLAVALAVTLSSLSILGPGIGEAQSQINLGFGVMTRGYALAVTPGALDTNHSLYTVVRYSVILAHHRHLYGPAQPRSEADIEAQVHRDEAMLRPAFTSYVVLTALSGLALYFLRIRRLPMLNQMLALTVCAVTLPPLSMDYTLLHLLIPFGLLCTYAAERLRANEPIKGLSACFLCLAFIFTAGTYFTVKYPLTCEFRALFLVLLFAAALRYPFRWRALDDTPVVSSVG